LEELEDFLAWARYTDMEEEDLQTSAFVQKPLTELGRIKSEVISTADGSSWIPTELGTAETEKPDYPGQYLVEPHARWIYEGRKTAIVKSSEEVIEPGVKYYLCSKEWIYGVFVCAEPIKLEKIEQFEEEHHVTREEAELWWPSAKTFFLYRIAEFLPFNPPRPWKRPQGVQNRVAHVEFKD